MIRPARSRAAGRMAPRGIPLVACLLAAAFAAALTAACEKKPAPPPARASSPQSADKDLEQLRDAVVGQTPSSGAMPPGHPPVAVQPSAAAAGDGGGASDAMPPGHPPVGEVPRPAAAFAPMSAEPPKYDVPADWQAQQPRTPMRRAQYVLPGSGGAADGEMVLFYFGRGEGGDVASNLARWKGMFTTADGQPVPEGEAKIERLEVGGLKVATLDIAGTYREPPMMNPQPPGPRPDHRMLCAIIEMPSGNWFFKGVGPTATMTAHEPAFRRLIQSLKAE